MRGSPILGEEHEQYLMVRIDGKLSLVLEKMMDDLTSKFEDLSISNTALQLCNQKLRNQFEESIFLLSRAKQLEKNQERYDRVVRWYEIDPDFMSNCISIDEAVFHINMKRFVT